MKLCIISDTHNKHKHLGNLPEADIIIHCGDMTSVGKEHEIRNFFKWFSGLTQYKHRICIAGNHDWLFERSGSFARGLVPSNVIYLEDNGVEIEGLKFYGTPVQKIFYNWAFNRPEEKLAKYYAAIPDDTDILITHNPPYMIGDLVPSHGTNEGSPSLYKEVTERVKPLISTFGHIHEGRGIYVGNNTTFINASNLDDNYDCVYNPIVVEIDENRNILIVNQ
jgi:Icc-related predicted phosphoesterase